MALREARRVLAPGGRLLCYEPRFPTPNRATQLVTARLIRRTLGSDVRFEALTLAPPLARRLRRADERAYRALSRIPGLRTHRLAVWEQPGVGPDPTP
jgi:ubiquinone/menaquinone biosynthesis C-methylase UbiE